MTIAKRICAKVFSIILSSVEIEPTEDARLLAIHQMDSDELLFEQWYAYMIYYNVVLLLYVHPHTIGDGFLLRF